MGGKPRDRRGLPGLHEAKAEEGRGNRGRDLLGREGRAPLYPWCRSKNVGRPATRKCGLGDLVDFSTDISFNLHFLSKPRKRSGRGMGNEDRVLRLQHKLPASIMEALNRDFVNSHHMQLSEYFESVLEHGFQSIKTNPNANEMLAKRIEQLRHTQQQRKEMVDVKINTKYSDQANKLKELIPRQYGRKGRIYRESLYRYLIEKGIISIDGDILVVNI